MNPTDILRLRGQHAFRRLLPGLLATRRGQYVAIHDGQVVESGDGNLAVARRAYARFGYVPIFVNPVTDEAVARARVLLMADFSL